MTGVYITIYFFSELQSKSTNSFRENPLQLKFYIQIHVQIEVRNF